MRQLWRDPRAAVSEQLGFDLGSSATAHPHLALWFDGASRGNGGPGARASIGGVVRDADTEEVLAEVSATIGEETNNVAEYRALLATIEAANAFGAQTLVVHGDSSLVIHQMRGEWKVKAMVEGGWGDMPMPDMPAGAEGGAPGQQGAMPAQPEPQPGGATGTK